MPERWGDGRKLAQTTVWMLFALATVSVGLAQEAVPKVSVARWPGDRKAAISLTFDDAMNTHLDQARSILKKHQLVGTFFVSTGRREWKDRKPEWQALAAEGNELANHTVNHPCLLEIIQPHSQDYTPEMMEAEIRDAAADIAATTNSHRGLTFAYPCGDMSFGKPAEQAKNEALYLTYVSRYAFGGRGYKSGEPQDPDDMDVLTIPDLGVTEAKDSAALIAMAQTAVDAGNWGVFCFHGVGGEWLSVTTDAMDGLAGHLQRHPEIWTASFGDVLRYSLERKAAALDVRSNADGSVDIRLSWPMPQTTYDLPLTLRVELASTWHSATAIVDGKPIHAQIVSGKPEPLLLIDVPVGSGVVHLARESR